MYLTSHVDDLLMLSPNIEHIKYVYEKLSECYTMTFDEEAREYLGYSITKDRSNRILKLVQSGTGSKILSHFPPQRFGRVPSSPYDKKERNLAENGESLSL